MSIKEHAEQAVQQVRRDPQINSVWELILAVLCRFGLGAGAVTALIVMLAYGTSIVWEDRAAAQRQLIEANAALVDHLAENANTKAKLATEMAIAQQMSARATSEAARANERLADAVENLNRRLVQ